MNPATPAPVFLPICHSASEQLLNQYYAKAYKQTVIDGVPWKPFYPTTFVISGKLITVKFYVPVPPLTFNRILVLDSIISQRFAYSDDSDDPVHRLSRSR